MTFLTPSPTHFRLHSDLHLEHRRDKKDSLDAYIPAHELDATSWLVLAGDITPIHNQRIDFLNEILATRDFQKIIYIPGNHEYYGGVIEERDKQISELNNIEKVAAATQSRPLILKSPTFKFLGCTLWADGGRNPMEEMDTGFILADFRVIRNKKGVYKVSDMQEIHRNHKDFLTKTVETSPDLPTIFVTHHLPSYSLCNPRFKSGNGGFASSQDDLMLSDEYPIQYWFFGHTHDRISRKIGNTQLESNPLGYPRENVVGYEKFCHLPLKGPLWK